MDEEGERIRNLIESVEKEFAREEERRQETGTVRRQLFDEKELGKTLDSIQSDDDDEDIVEKVAHSPTFPSLHLCHNSYSNLLSLYLCHSSFSNPSVASPMSQLILQPFFRFSYVTSSSLNSPGEPPMAFVE